MHAYNLMPKEEAERDTVLHVCTLADDVNYVIFSKESHLVRFAFTIGSSLAKFLTVSLGSRATNIIASHLNIK